MPDRTIARRVRRYRRKLADIHGLVRVEVLVPRDKTQEVREFAARLRAPAAGRAKLDRLLQQAVTEFGPLCLWNLDLSRRDDTMREVILARLRKYGGHRGWQLAGEIDAAARLAAAA